MEAGRSAHSNGTRANWVDRPQHGVSATVRSRPGSENVADTVGVRVREPADLLRGVRQRSSRDTPPVYTAMFHVKRLWAGALPRKGVLPAARCRTGP